MLYRKLFASDTDRARSAYLLESGGSGLDMVLDDATRLQRSLGGGDRAKPEKYFESLRAVEKRIRRQRTALD